MNFTSQNIEAIDHLIRMTKKRGEMKYFDAKVRSCPFCGCAKIGLSRAEPVPKVAFWLFCRDCQATGPFAVSEEEAIKKWGLEPGFDFESLKEPK